MEKKLRVLIAEDHESVRGVLVALLNSDFEVVAAVGDGVDLVKAAILYRPDAIVSDIIMPMLDGLSARKHLLIKGIDIPFVFITLDMGLTSPDSDRASYVYKSDLVELPDSLRTAAAGGTYLSRSFRKIWGNPQQKGFIP